MRTAEKEYPPVSIVIPARNEINYIENCLESFRLQSYPVDKLEVIVVDGRSTDGTRDKVQAYEKDYTVRLLDNPTGSTPQGLNIGLREARGEIGIIFSAHATADKDFVLNSIEALNRTGAACAGGKLINTSTGKFALLAGKVLGHPFGVGNSKFRYSNQAEFVDTVAYGAYRMEILHIIGLFDERLIRNQDIELNYRLRHKSYKLFFDPSIKSFYSPRDSYAKFCQQAYSNGYWNIITAKLCANSLSLRHFVPLAFVLAVLASMLLLVVLGNWLFLLLAIAPYLAVDLVVTTSLAKGPVEWAKIFGLFPSLHFAYGIGSCVALVKQLLRWRE